MKIWLNLVVKTMKYDYQYKITFKLNEPFDINYIKNVCNQYPNFKILVEELQVVLMKLGVKTVLLLVMNILNQSFIQEMKLLKY